jgi:hypothetical protein
VGRGTTQEILAAAGSVPRRGGRRPIWRPFLAAQTSGIPACGLHAGTVRLRRVYVLSVREIRARAVRILAVTVHPAGAWTAQHSRRAPC